MKKSLILGAVALLASSVSFAQSTPPHWTYNQPEGPNHWGNIDPGFKSCEVGANQSPIDIESGENSGLMNVSRDTSLEAINPNWGSSAFNMVNNGHTLQVNYDAGSDVSFEGKTFNLKQFHFHSPSEHILNGREYPLEMHFVHQSAAGILVIGVFYEQGQENPLLDTIWGAAPAAGQSATIAGLMINATDFLPKGMGYYNYQGSLTTPPCTEGVNWIVLKNPIEASAKQLQFLNRHMGGPNNRPIQPIDGRMIGTSEL